MGNKNLSNSQANKDEAQDKTNHFQTAAKGQKVEPISFDENIETKAEAVASNIFKGLFSPVSTQPGSAQKASKIDNVINLRDVEVIQQNEELNDYGNSNTSVPFSVVRISMDKGLINCINSADPNLWRRYDKDPSDPKNGWKINSKGYYFFPIGQNRIVIIKPGYTYEGQFLFERKDIIPHNSGKLFSNDGMFEGQFKNGVAHGQGSYTDAKNGSVSSGLWINGEIRSGEIRNKFYTYKGDFVQGVAHGDGYIEYPKLKASYRGGFANGIYEDEDAYMSDQIYDYSGGFKEGKKHGIGCLIQKQRKLQAKGKKYKPQEQFEGYFQNDIYKGKQKANANVTV